MDGARAFDHLVEDVGCEDGPAGGDHGARYARPTWCCDRPRRDPGVGGGRGEGVGRVARGVRCCVGALLLLGGLNLVLLVAARDFMTVARISTGTCW